MYFFEIIKLYKYVVNLYLIVQNRLQRILRLIIIIIIIIITDLYILTKNLFNWFTEIILFPVSS